MKKLLSAILALSVMSTMLAAAVVQNSAAEITAPGGAVTEAETAADDDKDADAAVGNGEEEDERRDKVTINPSDYTPIELDTKVERKSGSEGMYSFAPVKDGVYKLIYSSYDINLRDSGGSLIDKIGSAPVGDYWDYEYYYEFKAGETYYIKYSDASFLEIGECPDYSDYQVGEKREINPYRHAVCRFIPSRDMLVQFDSDDCELKITDGKTGQSSFLSWTYLFKSGTQYFISYKKRSYYGDESASFTSRELTANELSLGEKADYALDNDNYDCWYRFVLQEDMYVSVDNDYEGSGSVDIGSPDEYVRSVGYYSNTYYLSAGRSYYLRVKKSEDSDGYSGSICIKKPDEISLGETKTLTFDPEKQSAKAIVFTPDRDMLVRLKWDYQKADPDKSAGYEYMLIEADKAEELRIENRNLRAVSVFAGRTYIFDQRFKSNIAASEVKIEEIEADTVHTGDTIEAQPGYDSYAFYKYVPEKDMRIIVGFNYDYISPALLNQNLESVKYFNANNAQALYYSVEQGKTYYLKLYGRKKSNPVSAVRLEEINPVELELNTTVTSVPDSFGVRVYGFTPEENIVVGLTFPEGIYYSLAVYNESDSQEGRFTSNHLTVDYEELDYEYAGETYYYFLRKGVNYLFNVSVNGDKAFDFTFESVDLKDIELDGYHSLYTHVPNEILFFRYTADEDMMMEYSYTKEEDDERSIGFAVYDSDFNKLKPENNSVVLRSGTTYIFVGKVSFDLYCDDLDCGVTLTQKTFRSISAGETADIAAGEILRFAPDKDMMVCAYCENYNVKKLNGSFENESELSSVFSLGNSFLARKGDTYYFKNHTEDEDDQVTVEFISDVEPILPNERKLVSFNENTKLFLFSYTPETDMSVEFCSNKTGNDYYALLYISENEPVADWNNSVFQADLTAGKTYYFETKKVGWIGSPDSGSYEVYFKKSGSINLNEAIDVRSDSNTAEKSAAFTAPDDMLVRFACGCESWGDDRSQIIVTDQDGNTVAENASYSYEGAAVAVPVEKGKTYNVKAAFSLGDDDSTVYGEMTVSQIKDIKPGDEVKHSGWYRFVPEEDTYPVLKMTQTNGTESYGRVHVYDESFNYKEAQNDFGGEFVGVSKGGTYYLNIVNYKLRPEGSQEDPDDDEYDSTDFRYGDQSENEYAKIVFTEPEIIKAGETKPLKTGGEMYCLYQLAFDENTTVKVSGAGTGEVLACLKNSGGSVYRNSGTTDDYLFSFGYTVPAGQHLLITVHAYVDIDGEISVTAQGDFEIVDNKLVKYYGDAAEPKIPATVTEIGPSAFLYSNSTESIAIPDSVTAIDEYAFARCYSLKSVVIPGSVNSIGKEAFDFDTSLTELTLNEGLTEIGSHAFAVCNSLSEVKLPETLTTVGESAFLDCTSLDSIYIPKSVTSIGARAFGYHVQNNYEYGSEIKPLENFKIKGYKGSAAEAYATENGFTFVDVETEEVDKRIPGDVNGDKSVDENDLKALQDYLNKWDVRISMENADVNADGVINMKDVFIIRQYLNGIDVDLL